MSGTDLTFFIGTVLGQVAPIVLAVTTGALMALSVLAGIVSFIDRSSS
jgi:hypothetical protein